MITYDKLTFVPNIDLGDILLRKIQVKDYLDMFEYGSDLEVVKYLSWGPYKTKQQAKETVKNHFLKNPERGVPYAYAIIDKEKNKMIGTCDFHTLNKEEYRGEIGYALNRDYWGKGIMTKVCGAVIDFGFNYLELKTIDIAHHVDNIGSQRVIEKCGFRYIMDYERKGRKLKRYELSSKDLIIREATVNDAPGKGLVHYLSWQETYTGLIDQEYLDTLSLERSVEIAKQYPQNTFIAEIGGKTVGFAAYNKSRDNLEDTGEIMAIYVLKAHSKKGIGKLLMEACYQKLKEYSKVTVWVLSSNTNAIHFYEYLGFQKDGVEKEVDLKTTILHEIRLSKKISR